jgi:hypothetical protein
VTISITQLLFKGFLKSLERGRGCRHVSATEQMDDIVLSVLGLGCMDLMI